jgi:hypothetical protein
MIREAPTTSAIDWRFAGTLLACVVVAFVLWWTPLLLPFRLFVTMVHELSHALVAVLTGGQVLGIDINLNGSGVTLTRGGSLFLIASAGYVGSSAFGAALLVLSRRVSRRLLLQALAIGLVLATLFFFRDPVGIVGAVLLAIGFWALAARGSEWLVALLVYLLAVLNGLYALFDLLYLVNISGPAAASRSDAALLQQVTGLPALIWALLWLVMSVLVQWWALRVALRSPSAPRLSPGATLDRNRRLGRT